jgi:hypothetical protein
VESLLARPAGYIRDHFQCVPKRRLLPKFTQITALSAEICKPSTPALLAGGSASRAGAATGVGHPGWNVSPSADLRRRLSPVIAHRNRIEGPLPQLGLCPPDLIPELNNILPADHDRRTGTGTSGVDKPADAPPDMPVGELGRVGPPVRNGFVLGFPGRLLCLHYALQASLEALSSKV